MKYYIDLEALNDYLKEHKQPLIEIREGYDLDEPGEKLILVAKTVTETKNISVENDSMFLIIKDMIEIVKDGRYHYKNLFSSRYGVALKSLDEIGILLKK